MEFRPPVNGEATHLDVMTLGECMVLFAPERIGPLESVDLFRKDIAGAEANVACALSRLGHSVALTSRVGDDPFGRFILARLRGEGVDVSAVRIDPDHRTGIFFKEFAGWRTTVSYYRSNSAASLIAPGDIQWGRIRGARFLFITGITPSLSPSCRDAVFDAVARARELGIEVVLDPNLRLKLWTIDEAREVIDQLAATAAIVLPGTHEGKLLAGSDRPEAIAEHYLRLGARLVSVKLGRAGAYFQSVEGSGLVPGFDVPVVDEIGAGDAFAGGLLSGLLEGLDVESAVKRGCALGAIATTAVGDSTALPDRSALEAFLANVGEVER
jgi:2-dehydro-3-deoxygluconokinase